ncbi:hypothetical protein [Halorubrum ezzemoulense]|uniref:SWIM-type domain-containing protein n=1 Tax=Halorubrum ezzemoulense TaxID=337243 RepID=A0A256JUA2_HALEZ|nr:hypothetical protein [Halorubrum ezzemoulense]OYR72361.1 hypothetical protein DJ78_03130 [Halorubrum ezzemoulense]
MRLETLDFEQHRRDNRRDKVDLLAARIVRDDDRIVVRRDDADADAHIVQIVTVDGNWCGHCGCAGWEHNDGPCSHQWAVRRAHDADLIDIPERTPDAVIVSRRGQLELEDATDTDAEAATDGGQPAAVDDGDDDDGDDDDGGEVTNDDGDDDRLEDFEDFAGDGELVPDGGEVDIPAHLEDEDTAAAPADARTSATRIMRQRARRAKLACALRAARYEGAVQHAPPCLFNRVAIPSLTAITSRLPPEYSVEQDIDFSSLLNKTNNGPVKMTTEED